MFYAFPKSSIRKKMWPWKNVIPKSSFEHDWLSSSTRCYIRSFKVIISLMLENLLQLVCLSEWVSKYGSEFFF